MLKGKKGWHATDAGQLRLMLFSAVCIALIVLHFLLFFKGLLDDDTCSCTDSNGLLNTTSFYNITDDIAPVFVTAFSQSHFMEGKRLVASIREFHKTAKIVVYDLGLSLKGIVRVRRWCGVEYRRFRFEEYPLYFEQLFTFRWKPIVIATIEERDARETYWKKGYPWDTVQWTANVKECKKSTYLLHGFTGHGIYPATDPALYSYFPVSLQELKKPKAKMYEAGLVLAVKIQETVTNILKWSVLCALEERCMATGIIPNACNFNNSDLYATFARCHRYDQSVINVLLADAYYYDRRYYTSEITDFFRIQRFLTRTVRNRELKCA
ncbi:unnamed protein product [Heligmosomoides polygyrus]|uniref:SGNH domain-containing protein n=1 Tax=Heligmosomoides polygyrus TaxID=6339 RepID=A0A183FL22_HELPZ|nr:unnamed protein product [Heligmosomoides polygyrus]